MVQLLAMFPGQGSQFVGMGSDLFKQFPLVKPVFEEAEDAARLSIRKLCFDGPEDELRLTANTQPCILTVSVAVWRILKNETGLEPHCYAGHSLGEYSALVAAGKIPLSRAAFLVRQRGNAMQQAVPPDVGAMAAVLNLASDELVARCAKQSVGGRSVEVVNFNSPQQLVVAGHKAAVDALCKDLEGVEGVRCVPLPVSAPFHSSLMKPAREAMTPLLNDTKFEQSETKVIANLTGKIEPNYGPQCLIEQIDSPVLWTQSIETAQKEHCEVYLEIGPGKVLFGLARRILPRGPKLLHTEDVVSTIEAIKGLGH